MLSVFICEDDLRECEQLQKIIEEYILIEDLDMRLALSSQSPDDIIKYVAMSPSLGLYFLDVELSHNLDGITLAERIREYDPRGFIVFITSHAQKLQLTFQYKVEAMDFIVKGDPTLSKRICECIDNAYNKYKSGAPSHTKVLPIRLPGNRYAYLDFTKIICFKTSETVKHKIEARCEDRFIEFYGSLNDIEQSLDSNFYRCHKSFIANLTKVKEFDKKHLKLYMWGGTECWVSKKKAGELVARLSE
jgi:two-component system response regulator AgrA